MNAAGHIDTALPAAKVVDAAGVFAGILAGMRQPSTMVDSDTAEYNTGDFAFLLAHPVPKQQPQFPPPA